MRLLVLVLCLHASLGIAAQDVPPPPPPPPPDAATEAQPLPPTPPTDVKAAAHPNWARTAATISFIAGGVTLGLSLIAEIIGVVTEEFNVSRDQFTGGRALMLLPTVVTAAGVPVVFLGGRSARWTRSVTGSNAFRILGWSSYGVALLFDLVSVLFAGYVPGTRTIAGVLGAGAFTFFGFDALWSAQEAADVESMADASGVRVAPVFSLLAGPQGSGSGAMFGLRGAF